MLHLWGAIEADFLRDYRIDLLEQLDYMTWRKFLVLLNNLSPNGAVAVQIRSENEKPEPDEQADEVAANAFFTSVLSSY